MVFGCLLFKHRYLEDKQKSKEVIQFETSSIPYLDDLNEYQNETLKNKKLRCPQTQERNFCYIC